MQTKNILDKKFRFSSEHGPRHARFSRQGRTCRDLARATTAGLIINELVTNSYKYAFPPGYDCMASRGEPCRIRVTLARENGTAVLTVADNGQGLPSRLDPLATKSLGLKLVTFLARYQLQAEMQINRKPGTEFIFRMERPEKDG